MHSHLFDLVFNSSFFPQLATQTAPDFLNPLLQTHSLKSFFGFELAGQARQSNFSLEKILLPEQIQAVLWAFGVDP